METNSLFARAIHPLKLLGVVFIFFLVFVAVLYTLQSTDTIDPKPVRYWEAAFTSVMIFIIFSSALSFSYPNKTKYFMFAIISFLILMISTGILAAFISGQHIDVGGAGSFRWMYVMLTFSYLVLLAIVNSMFKILEFVKKQDARLRGEDES
jgi:uncharacterized membrane protein